MHVKTLRFSQLKPREMENSAFMYHLKRLIQDDYVVQNQDKMYTLTPKGLSYVDTLTFSNHKPRMQPKVIGIIALRDSQGRYLLAKRLQQPTIHTWMLPSGKQHIGESPDSHAARQLAEWMSQIIPLKRRGFMDLRIYHRGELVTHIAAHVYSGEYTGAAPNRSSKFVFEWHPLAAKIDYTPGTYELLEQLENKDEFFLSLDASYEPKE